MKFQSSLSTSFSYQFQLFVVFFGPLKFFFKIFQIHPDWNVVLPRPDLFSDEILEIKYFKHGGTS
jgi:hypothetical protein